MDKYKFHWLSNLFNDELLAETELKMALVISSTVVPRQ